jgi:hypothetical protein
MAFIVNSPESTFQIDFNNAVVEQPAISQAPIDLFYEQRRLALQLAAAPPLDTDELRPLALVPLFSGAEMYFRRFLAKAIEICPLCAEHAGTQQVALGSFSALDKSERAFAIAEHQGFTSEGEIARRTLKVLGVDTNRHASLRAAIAEFETICHLRHALVHCGGELMYLNRRNLGIAKVGRLALSIPVVEFQGVVLKVSNVVRAYNAAVGLEIFRRWFREGYLSSNWGSDRLKTQKLVRFLWSSSDMGAAPNVSALYIAVRAMA